MRSSCPECGFSAVPNAALDLCPNCRTPLRGDPPPPPPPLAPEALRARVDAWPEEHRGHLLVEIVKRSPGQGAYRDSPAVRDKIRIRLRIKWWRTHVLITAWLALVVLVLGIGAGTLEPSTFLCCAFLVGWLTDVAIQVWASRRRALEFHPGELVLGGGNVVPTSRVRALERESTRRGDRVLVVLNDGQVVQALDQLSERQADYLVELLSDTLGVDANA
jgi:hypothetical protein